MFDVTRGFSGDVASVTPTSSGTGFVTTETITILGANVGGSTPADNIIITVDAVSSDGASAKVEEIILTSGNITTLVVESNGGIQDTDSVAKVGTPSTTYAVDTLNNRNVYYLDDGTGSGSVYLPDLTLYSGNTYRFNNSAQSSHPFKFSQFRDGTHPPSTITGVATTVDLSTSTKTVVVTDTTGIVVGMSVSTSGGGGASGQVDVETFVVYSLVLSTSL